MTFSAYYVVPTAVTLALSGAWMLFFAGHYQAWHERRYQARLADRLARGTDAYFEELREIEAYPPRRFSPSNRKISGALSLIVGVSYLAIWLTK
jgi:hypothetical protein